MNIKFNHRLGIIDVKFFSRFELNLKFDSIASTFSVDFYFDPSNPDHAEMATVSHFHECILEHNGETLITGYALSNFFKQSSKKELAKIAGYSKPGVLEDCDIPPIVNGVEQSKWLQYDGMTLREIAQQIIAPFKLKLVVDGVASKASNEQFTLDEKLDKKISKTTALESKNIKSYLMELAIQRNIILSHDVNGSLLFTEAKTNLAPLFHVEAGVIATDISMSFNGQGIHSQITVVKQASSAGDDGAQFTIYNPYCPIVFRPRVVVQSSGDVNTIEDYAKNVLASELKNIVLTVTIDRWVIDGKVIKPNNTITVYSPENYIYEKTKFFIESVSFVGDSKQQIAVLTCVVPEVYNRQTPVNVFIDAGENLPRI